MPELACFFYLPIVFNNSNIGDCVVSTNARYTQARRGREELGVN